MVVVVVDFLGETRIIIIMLQIIIISSGNPLASNSLHFSWNPKYNFGINTFWFPVKVEGMTDERGTSTNYYY